MVSATGDLVMEDTEKAKGLYTIFCSVIICKSSLQEFQAPATRVEVQNKNHLLLLEENQVREHLNKLNIHNEAWGAG